MKRIKRASSQTSQGESRLWKHNTAFLFVSGDILTSCSRLIAADEQQTETSDLFSGAAASLDV